MSNSISRISAINTANSLRTGSSSVGSSSKSTNEDRRHTKDNDPRKRLEEAVSYTSHIGKKVRSLDSFGREIIEESVKPAAERE